MSTTHPFLPTEPEYAWEVATLFPEQGHWSEEAYLSLTDGTNKRIEFLDGRLEFLSMPTELHQALVGFLYHALLAFVKSSNLGVVPFPPLRVRVRPGKVREPDVLFLRRENYHLRANRIWGGADLVMEIVSPDPKDRQRDYEEKLHDYAAARISEYWIVDPERRAVLVHTLQGDRYTLAGEYSVGTKAASVLLSGFEVNVQSLFQAIEELPE
jgi:Uma2 family endonuclease